MRQLGTKAPNRQADGSLATVDPISAKIPWNAHAALGDALQSCAITDKVVVVWCDADGIVHYTVSTPTALDAMMMLEGAKLRMLENVLKSR